MNNSRNNEGGESPDGARQRQGAPHQPEAEAGMLACLLMQPDLMGTVRGRCSEEWFFARANAFIWRALVEFDTEGKALDPVLIIAWAKACPDEAVRRAQTEIERRCAELVGYVPSALNFDRYKEVVEDAAMRRLLMRTADDLHRLAKTPDRPWKEALDEAEGRLFAARGITSFKGTRHAGAVAMEVLDQFEARYAKRGHATMGIPSGFADIDRIINGFHAPQLITIAARPAMGKTSLLWNFVEGAGMTGKSPAPVAFYSLEMSDSEILERGILGLAKVDFSKGRTGMFSKGDFGGLTSAVSQIADSKIFIFDGYSLTIGDLCAQIRSDVRKHGLKMVFIDYGQLIKASTKQGQREMRLGIVEVWQTLKGLSKSLMIPIAVLAQAGRGADENPGRPPQLKDLQESSAIEQASDIVAFIHRASYYIPWQRMKEEKREEWEKAAEEHKNTTGEGPPGDGEKSIGQRFYEAWTQFVIAKHRNGAVCSVDLIFHAERARFEGRTKKQFSNNPNERQQH